MALGQVLPLLMPPRAVRTAQPHGAFLPPFPGRRAPPSSLFPCPPSTTDLIYTIYSASTLLRDLAKKMKANTPSPLTPT